MLPIETMTSQFKIKNPNPLISEESFDFYQNYFRQGKTGGMFLLQAFPVLYRKTLQALDLQLGPSLVQVTVEKLAAHNRLFPLTGQAAIAAAPDNARSAISELPLFSRVCLGLRAAEENPKWHSIPERQAEKLLSNFYLPAQDQQFYETRFPSFHAGASYILDSFPQWYDQSVEECRELQDAHGSFLEKAMCGFVHALPSVAGEVLIRRVQEISPHAETPVAELERHPVFTRFCLELHYQGSRELRTVSPRVRLDAIKGLEDIFGATTTGTQFAAEVFPHAFWATLRELYGKFTAQEMALILEVLADAGNLRGAAGSILVPVCKQIALESKKPLTRSCAEALSTKLAALPYFACLALELWAINRPDFPEPFLVEQVD